MPNIAQQDYIIIDWEGKKSSDATKKAEVDAQLKNIYLANPLSLLSVIFKNYGVTISSERKHSISYNLIISVVCDDDDTVTLGLHEIDESTISNYIFFLT